MLVRTPDTHTQTDCSIRNIIAICEHHNFLKQAHGCKTVQSNTHVASDVGRWQKNSMSRTPATPATVRMINSRVRDSAVMYVSSANRKYTMRLPNSKLPKPAQQIHLQHQTCKMQKKTSLNFTNYKPTNKVTKMIIKGKG